MAFISCNYFLDHGATGVFVYRVLFSGCLDHECGAKWVGVVRDDGAGAAHLKFRPKFRHKLVDNYDNDDDND